MFKSKLTTDDKYYSLRRKGLLFMLMPPIITLLLMNHLQGNPMNAPTWLIVLLASVGVLFLALQTKIGKQLVSSQGQKLIEIDESEIRIKSIKGAQKETIKLNEIDQLTIKANYTMYQDSMTAFAKEIAGKEISKNFIIVHHNNKERKFDFEFESNYMLKQLNKVIDSWKQKEYTIEYLSLIHI